MRELTDAEDAQLRERYPQIWTKCHGRALLMSTDPIKLQLRVYDQASKLVMPVEVKGFDLALTEKDSDMPRKFEADRPENVNQKGPSPTQGVLTREPAQKGVPYQSGKATPNKSVK